MSRLARASWSLMVLSLLVAGCADNAMVLQGRLSQSQKEQVALNSQYQQLQERAVALDKDNQELSARYAQAQQQAGVFEDQLAALRDQLRTVTSQLAQTRSDKEKSDKRVQAMTASMQRQGGVSIEPNNSFLQNMPAVNIPGVQVRRDGDVIRVELPGSGLFVSGSARLRPEAANLISDVATEIARTYPDQMIGVEGHTDSDPMAGNQWQNNHALSVSRAMAVYGVLAQRTRLRADQLFVIGHGSNHPIASNGTQIGKQRNRRVELVIYPERKN